MASTGSFAASRLGFEVAILLVTRGAGHVTQKCGVPQRYFSRSRKKKSSSSSQRAAEQSKVTGKGFSGFDIASIPHVALALIGKEDG